jgi:hypothetical protein
LAIVVTILIVVVGGAAGLGYWVVHEENSPGERPVPTIMRRRGRVIRKTMAGDPCLCGGTLEESGIVSPRYGELLRCAGCRRRWTMDGRRVSARRGPRRPGTMTGVVDEMPDPADQ